ncbi:MAG: cyclin-dependent protein serine/threonine kinase activity, partial [Paramarteilia canceri]
MTSTAISAAFRRRMDSEESCRKNDVTLNFDFEGCKIGKGTYGSVYKATSKD